MREARLAAGCWLAAFLLSGCLPATSREATEAPMCRPAQSLVILPPTLNEVSGVVRDPRRPDVHWMHNDGGNAPVLFAVDTVGRIVGRAWIRNVQATDPEDLALGRCADGWCLYLGDIGDNLAQRRQVAVFRIPLPTLPAAKVTADGSAPEKETSIDVLADRTYRLVYPDGPRDAEALFVDDRRGELIVISKGREGASVAYEAPLAAPGEEDTRPPGTIPLRRLGPLQVTIDPFTGQLITAADLSPDGRWIAVRSYTTLYFLPWSGAARFDSTASIAGHSLLAALEPIGEGVAFSDSSTWLYLTSEGGVGDGPRLDRIRCSRESMAATESW